MLRSLVGSEMCIRDSINLGPINRICRHWVLVMDIGPLINWMKQSAVHNFVTQNTWVWPTLETFHFLGLCLLLGSLILVDLRVLGFNKKAPLKEIHAFVPLTITGFSINALTGLLFLFGDPERYFPNVAFQFKICLLYTSPSPRDS